ncbi:PREDICTED: uncharacterized protein LOC109154456 [Ipomoea nil]|uniref:uncharacterized protein LOC109154456 n=1 Tax=Ipomoea nil TaxID=35883 RepID=UPI0009009605|nr:PREDICTED: uncharacterized protein LOC109154456 [Ipomoea nil]
MKGGLGFRDLRSMNLALLELGNNPSYIWRGLLEAKQIIRQWARRSIGDGRTTTIGCDPWLVTEMDPYVTTDLHLSIREAPVSSLLREDGVSWDVACVNDVFDERDANYILNISVSICKPADSWVWFGDSKGRYTVKSCYRLITGESNDDRPWNLIGSLQGEDESTEHLFHDCLHAANLWSTINLPPLLLQQGNVIDWFFQRLRSLSGDLQCLFVMLCWGLWGSRNDSVWRGMPFDQESVLRSSVSFLHNWRAVNEQASGVVHASLESWKPPTVGRLKLNTDATISVENNAMGLGWVLRDQDGRFMAARSMRVPGRYMVVEAEVLCLREALVWLCGTGMGNVDSETDSHICFHALNSDSFTSAFGFLIDDVKHIASTIDGVSFECVRRSANRAAHAVAREAVSVSGPREWFDMPPLYLVAILNDDLMN